jgi:hypothetical protein
LTDGTSSHELFARARTLIPGERYDKIDLVLVRENLEGLYVGFEHYIPIGDEFETEGFWPIHWQQAGVRYTWDGEESYGMMERSSQAEVVSG